MSIRNARRFDEKCDAAVTQCFGNIGSDRIDGGPGNDRINVVDKTADRVVCGPGNDVVFADPRDSVAKDCESVRR